MDIEREQSSLVEALLDTALAINNSLQPNEVLQRILENVGRVVPHDAVTIMEIENGVARPTLSLGYIERGQLEFISNVRLSLADTPTLRQIAETRRALVIPDVTAYPDWVDLPGARWVRSHIGAPLLVEGETTGFLTLDSATPGFYTDQYIRPLQAFANQAALAIANARLYARTQQRARRLALLNQLSIEINQSLELEVVLQSIVNGLAQVLNVAQTGLALFDDDGQNLTLVADHSAPGSPSVIGDTIPIKGNPSMERILATRKPLFIADAANDPLMVNMHDLMVRRKVKSILIVPFVIRDRVIGTLGFDFLEQQADISAEEMQLAETVANLAAVRIQESRLYEQVRRQALVDELTGVCNYRGLLILGEREVARAQRFKRPLAALFFDIDNFRDFNNQYGHEIGNMILTAVARRASCLVRSVDLTARFGGEEFLILLPETNLAEAVEIAERLRQAVEDEKVETPQGNLHVTISVGAAELTGETLDLLGLVDSADRAMFIAKRTGRNRTAY